jgi:hypothetical protein
MLNISPKGGFIVLNKLFKLTTAVGLVLLFAIAASAYTLVFRNGNRLEIPSDFILTRTTVTYEISPGFNKSLQLILIDVAATERANKEAPGSFYKHKEEMSTSATQPAPRAATTEPSPRATRTLTNGDLAAIRERRIASEQAYEKRRKELDLPTVEETRRRQDAESAELRAQLRVESAAKSREEGYWRQRARALRTEIAMVDTQINYARSRLNEVNQSNLNNLGIITDVYPIWPPLGRQGGWPNYPNIPFGWPGTARPIPGLGYPYPYPYPQGPFGNTGNSTEKSDLTYRLDDLQARRGALAVQWRALEDEARDARVPQVWLEP